MAASWSTVSPKVKSIKGTPKGDKGKGTKGTKGDKGNGRAKKARRNSKNPVGFLQSPKKDATKVNIAQDIIEC